MYFDHLCFFYVPVSPADRPLKCIFLLISMKDCLQKEKFDMESSCILC